MTGMLKRLAAQAAGVPPAVRPRPRSRFEPLPGAPPAPNPPELDEERVAVQPRAQPAGSPIARRDGGDPPHSTRAAPTPPSPPASVPTVGPEVVRTPPARTDHPSGMPVVERPAAAGRPSAAVPERPIVRPVEPERPLPPRVADGVQALASPTRAADSGLPTPVAPTPGALIGPPLRLPAAPVLVSTGSERRPSAPVEQSSPPDIHVTIGRIDVRAPAPPPTVAAAPAATREAPGLGLTDYLRERSDGRRR